MKHVYLLGLAAILSLGLASCGGGGGDTDSKTDTTTQTSEDPYTAEEYQTAVNKMADMPIAMVQGQTALTPSFETKLAVFNYVTLTTKQAYTIKNKGAIDVSIAWDFDKTQEHASSISMIGDVRTAEGEIDEYHKRISFRYSKEGEISPVKFTARLTAGSASKDIEFIVKLSQNTYNYDKMSVEEFYSTGSNNLFKWCTSDGSIGKNVGPDGQEQDYYYVEIPVKIVYIAADENFAIGADGARFVYLYKINGMNLSVGRYYAVGGEIAQYKGSVQLSYISYADELTDHSAIADPVMDNVVDAETILGYSQCSDKHMYSVKLEGLTLKKKITSFNMKARGTFVVKQGGKELTIAYDYHTGAAANKEADAWKEALLSLETTDTFNLYGNLIYNSEDTKFSSSGHSWQVMPMVNASSLVKVG